MRDEIRRRKKLIAAYESLTPLERALVHLCSVQYVATNPTTLFKILRRTRITFPQERIGSVGALMPYLGRLREMGILGSQYQCQESVVEVITRRALAAGHYETMARAVQEEIPLRNPYYESRSRFCSLLTRDLRIAVYTHNLEMFSRCNDQIQSRCHVTHADADPVVRVCNTPFDKEWFGTLPLDFQHYALPKIFENTISHLEPDEDALAYALDQGFIDKIAGKEDLIFYCQYLAHRLVLAGRLGEAGRLADQMDQSGYTRGMRAVIRFFEGKNDLAIELFESDLREYRKRVGRKNAYFGGMEGVYFILALLRRQDTGLLKRIEELINLAQNKLEKTSLAPVYASLRAIFYVQSCEPDRAREIIVKNDKNLDSLSAFFGAFAAYWLDNRLTSARIDALSSIFIKAMENGLSWLAMECAELLRLTEQDTPIRRNYIQKVQSDNGIVSLVASVPVEEAWRKNLRALVRSTSPQVVSPKQTADKRLVWLLRFDDGTLHLQPVEQKISAKGIWTKGRSVALSRLYSKTNLEYISSQDERVVAALSRSASYYYSPIYQFDMEKALPALVGHPLLFLEKSPTVSVELVRGEPEVLVTLEEGEIHIAFLPQAKDAHVVVLQETPTRFKVVEISDENRRIARIMGERGLNVPESAKDEVLAAISAISSLVTVHSAIGGTAKDIVEVKADSTPHLHLMPSGSGLRFEVFVKPFAEGGPYLKPGVGTEILIAEIAGNRMQTRRDLILEERMAWEMEAGCPRFSGFLETDRQWVIPDPQDCLQVLLDLKALQEGGKVVVEWPEGEKFRVTREVSFSNLHLRIQGRTDWFELGGELRVDDSLILDMRRLLELVRTNNSRFIPLGEGQFLALTRDLRRRLEELEAYSERRAKDIRLHPLAALAMGDLTDNVSHLDADSRWKSQLESIQLGLELDRNVPSTLKADLRQYQVEGFKWLARLAHLGMGACLADDMGLGKTVQTLALILDRASNGPTLVVAPTSVCMNWVSEAKRFAPTLNVSVFGGNNRVKVVRSQNAFDVLVCSYGLLYQEIDLLASLRWQTIVLDEAQLIKNMTTKRSQAAMNLKGDFRVITTGTPVENHLSEFWTLFNFINPGLLGSFRRFNERFAIPVEKYNNRDAKRRLKKLIQPFILRRTKPEVLEELPPRTEVVLQVEMSREESAFYEALRQQALERLELEESPAGQRHIKILAEIMKLRQACCNARLVAPGSRIPSSKLALFGEVLSELIENRHKALVFSQFVGHLNLIREYLDKKNIEYRYLDGSTSLKDRKREVDAFQAGFGDVFLISLKAGGLGLNLTAADYVIHMDPWWNPAVEDQAADRAHRIGQQHPVTIYRLVTQNTIEEKIVRLHQEKRDLANSLLEGTDVSGKISADELLGFIRGE